MAKRQAGARNAQRIAEKEPSYQVNRSTDDVKKKKKQSKEWPYQPSEFAKLSPRARQQSCLELNTAPNVSSGQQEKMGKPAITRVGCQIAGGRVHYQSRERNEPSA